MWAGLKITDPQNGSSPPLVSRCNPKKATRCNRKTTQAHAQNGLNQTWTPVLAGFRFPLGLLKEAEIEFFPTGQSGLRGVACLGALGPRICQFIRLFSL